ncbi:HVA22/TB2/DP1 family protein, putative [Plasmodium ovale]|uniref:HVA22/TB2/DP1 family protein, putative n=1 Tax=Plasmodium ovale TaxID=36330 RepID=A0A1D3TH15_PLAOA|nr:HVA22/TB2/DP1 family protein, putative [Plasmodium ovale]
MKTAKIYSKNKEKDQEKSASYGSPQNLNNLRRLSSKVLGDSLNGFDLNKALEKIDEHVKKYPVLNDMGKKLGIKPSYVVVSVGGFLLLSLIFGWGAALICNMVGFAYPAYQSFKAVESQSHDETKLWLTYWVVFSLFFFIEYLIDVILFWVPFYYLVKLLFLLYLYMPQVRGAETVYNLIIRPILLKHEKTIDDTVQKISQTATNHLTQITGNLTEKLAQDGVRRRNV